MIDINLLRDKFIETKDRLLTRNKPMPKLDRFLEIDTQWRKLITEIQKLNQTRNNITEQIASYIKNNKNQEVDKLKKEIINIKYKNTKNEKQLKTLDDEIQEIIYSLPNIPDKSVPIGKDETQNVEIRKWGIPKTFDFQPKPHWELAEQLDMADFTRATKIAGSRHTIFKNDGAKLIRILRDFTIDCHVKNGYVELLPPVLINDKILYGTGHLPKSKDDMFCLTNGQYLSATEEVPLTGYYNGEILDGKILPIFLTSSTLSFRSEAGSAGKDIRGIIRQHQFYNTEMVMICKQEESFELLEKMTSHCEHVLKELKIPYRVIELCTGDIGTAACKTYDVEVWFAAAKQFREISSCSNCTDYQARGSLIRYRDNGTTKYVHTLNGTGTSLNRLWVAIVEYYQEKDGRIKVPDALKPYFSNKEYFN